MTIERASTKSRGSSKENRLNRSWSRTGSISPPSCQSRANRARSPSRETGTMRARHPLASTIPVKRTVGWSFPVQRAFVAMASALDGPDIAERARGAGGAALIDRHRADRPRFPGNEELETTSHRSGREASPEIVAEPRHAEPVPDRQVEIAPEGNPVRVLRIRRPGSWRAVPGRPGHVAEAGAEIAAQDRPVVGPQLCEHVVE